MHTPDDYKDLKLKLDGIVPAGHGFHRNLLFDAMYASLPRDPQVKVQIYNAEIVPGGFTNWHCHNGAASSSRCRASSRHISKRAYWSRPKPANAIPNRSPNFTAGTTRIPTCPIYASAYASPRLIANT